MTDPTDNPATTDNTPTEDGLPAYLDAIAGRVTELRDQLFALGEDVLEPDTTPTPDLDSPERGPLSNQAIALAVSISELTSYVRRLRDVPATVTPPEASTLLEAIACADREGWPNAGKNRYGDSSSVERIELFALADRLARIAHVGPDVLSDVFEEWEAPAAQQ